MKKKMEIKHLAAFMNQLLAVKRQYPMILTYVKFLASLGDKEAKNEVDLFKKWLIRNPHIHEERFDQADFKTGKQSVTLCMSHFLKVTDFWPRLQALERELFAGEAKPVLTETDKLLDSLEKDAMLSGLVQQIKQLVDMHQIDISNPSDVLTNIQNIPGFEDILKDLIQNIQNGAYPPQHVIGIMHKILAVTDDNPNVVPTIKHALNMVVGQLGDMVQNNNEEARQQLQHMMNTIITNTQNKDDLMAIIQHSINEEKNNASNR